MRLLSEKVRKRIYERIRKRYKRFAKRNGEPQEWKEILLDGLYFKDALAEELAKEEELAKKGEESMLKHSREVEEVKEFTPRRERKSNMDWIVDSSDVPKGHSEDCECPKCIGGFSDPTLIDSTPIPESDERREARKELERQINEGLEEACSRGICPICKSSVCRCGED